MKEKETAERGPEVTTPTTQRNKLSIKFSTEQAYNIATLLECILPPDEAIAQKGRSKSKSKE
jgi:hypothetical protein